MLQKIWYLGKIARLGKEKLRINESANYDFGNRNLQLRKWDLRKGTNEGLKVMSELENKGLIWRRLLY